MNTAHAQEDQPVWQALWVGGPSGTLFKNIEKALLKNASLEVKRKWEKHKSISNQTIPRECNIVVINIDVVSHSYYPVIADAKKRGIPWVFGSNSNTTTIQNMIKKQLIPDVMHTTGYADHFTNTCQNLFSGVPESWRMACESRLLESFFEDEIQRESEALLKKLRVCRDMAKNGGDLYYKDGHHAPVDDTMVCNILTSPYDWTPSRCVDRFGISREVAFFTMVVLAANGLIKREGPCTTVKGQSRFYFRVAEHLLD